MRLPCHAGESFIIKTMKLIFSPLRLALTSLAGAALLTSCEKKEAVVETPPAAPAVPAAEAPVVSITPAAATPETPVGGQEAALAGFKSEIKDIKAFMEANQESKDPAAGLENLRELVRRAVAVKTEGLPPDLTEAYQAMTGVMTRLQTTLDDLPVPVDQMETYMAAEKAKGGTAEQEIVAKLAAFQTAMASHQKDGEAASAKLKEIGAKYGIESLDLGGK